MDIHLILPALGWFVIKIVEYIVDSSASARSVTSYLHRSGHVIRPCMLYFCSYGVLKFLISHSFRPLASSMYLV